MQFVMRLVSCSCPEHATIRATFVRTSRYLTEPMHERRSESPSKTIHRQRHISILFVVGRALPSRRLSLPKLPSQWHSNVHLFGSWTSDEGLSRASPIYRREMGENEVCILLLLLHTWRGDGCWHNAEDVSEGRAIINTWRWGEYQDVRPVFSRENFIPCDPS